jgi:hypothetical protein
MADHDIRYLASGVRKFQSILGWVRIKAKVRKEEVGGEGEGKEVDLLQVC